MDEIGKRFATYLVGVGEMLANARRHILHLPPRIRDYKLDVSLRGKTCIVTGGNAGIGFATASEMLKRGCNVILACRSIEKAEAAVQNLRDRILGGESGAIEVMEVSLTSLASVRKFCNAFNQRERALHYLILNAGVMGEVPIRHTTEDGFEEHFQVNHLSQWLMACTLLKEQRRRREEGRPGASDTTRVVILSSFMHMGGHIDFDDLQLQKGRFTGYRGYCTSKLENVLTVKEMNRKLAREFRGDAAVAVHPGLVNTSLAQGWIEGRDIFGPLQIVTAVLLRWARSIILESPYAAAQTVIFAALASASQVGGKYVAYGKVRPSSEASCDPDLAAALWQASMDLTKEKDFDTL